MELPAKCAFLGSETYFLTNWKILSSASFSVVVLFREASVKPDAPWCSTAHRIIQERTRYINRSRRCAQRTRMHVHVWHSHRYYNFLYGSSSNKAKNSVQALCLKTNVTKRNCVSLLLNRKFTYCTIDSCYTTHYPVGGSRSPPLRWRSPRTHLW